MQMLQSKQYGLDPDAFAVLRNFALYLNGPDNSESKLTKVVD